MCFGRITQELPTSWSPGHPVSSDKGNWTAERTSHHQEAILDIKMPRMDGMETLRQLRQKSDLPVIFLTSKEEDIDELFGRGAL